MIASIAAACRLRDLMTKVIGRLMILLLVTACATPAPVTTPGTTPVATPLPGKATDVPPYDLRLLKGGTEMELAGGMPIGTTLAVEKMLDAAPQVKVIHLNSIGGQITEGLALEGLIRKYRLITYSSAACISACTIAFLAGRERYLATDAWLGFHSSARKLGADSFALGNTAMRDIYRREGLPDKMIDQALATAPSNVWYPSHEDLLAAHAIDAVVDASRFARSGVPHWRNAAEVDAYLQMTPVYATMAARDIKHYNLIRDTYLKGAQADHTYQEIEAQLRIIYVDQLIPDYMKIAPDEVLLGYWQVMIDELEYLSQHDAKSCAATIFPDLGISARDLEHTLPPALLRREADAFSALVNAALADPQPHAGADTEQHLAVIFAAIYKKSPKMVEVMAKPKNYVNDPALLCSTSLAFAKEIAALGDPHEVGLVLRAIFSKV